MDMAKAIASSLIKNNGWEIRNDISILELENKKEDVLAVLGTSWPHFGYVYHNRDKICFSLFDGIRVWKSFKLLEKKRRSMLIKKLKEQS